MLASPGAIHSSPVPYHAMDASHRVWLRWRRKVQIIAIMMFIFACLSLYTLCFNCCSLASPSRDLQGDGRSYLETDQGGYYYPGQVDNAQGRPARDLHQQRRHSHNRLARKTLHAPGGFDMSGNSLYFDKSNHEDSKFGLNLDRNQVFSQLDEDIDANSEENEKYNKKLEDLSNLQNEYPNNNKYHRDEKSNHLVNIDKVGSRKLPQALIIGVKKGGTRALLEFLRIHPDVRAPGPEPHFFDRHYHRGIDWYRRQMPPTLDGQLTLEKTPSYFVTKGVPARIYNMSHDIKLLIVVRDPVTRAISDYTQTSSKRPDVKPFEEMAFLDNTTGLVDTSWGAIRIGVYAKHLERWLKYFPLTSMHFVNGEKLISNPAEEMAAVQTFLGLKNVITQKHFYFNTTKGFPCLKKGEGSSNPHCLGKTKGRPHPIIDPKVLQRLRDFFRPFNAKFYQMIGMDMGWPS